MSISVSISVEIDVPIGMEIEQSQGFGNVSVCTHRNWLEIVDIHIQMTCRCSV